KLAELGAVVIDSDRLAREVIGPGTDGLAEVVTAFGTRVLTPEGQVDRPALAAMVFGDNEARARLNAIVHPRVRDRAAQLAEKAPDDAVVVQDIPLLVENGMFPAFHIVIVVDADVPSRVRRLVTDRGMTERDARARIAAQATTAERKAAADVWLDNSGDPGQVLAAATELWACRLVPFEANVRLGRCASRGTPRIVAYDPTWPDQAERIMSRIRLAAGDAGLRVDHIGPTSVPGLATRDVIDVQLTVASLADADAIADRLGDAGFPVVPGLTRDTPSDDDANPEQWGKRVHCGADPRRWVNVQVRVVGTPAWRFALLFPAWLRATASAAAEYAEVIRRLAERDEDTSIADYAGAKEPWFERARPRALRWARQESWSPPS
ncbi:MAG: dephospho-CoA kinase, partial [Kutzneria sp.]|nr:dephospho-CoA kinase [Kutzneria sp.]